MFLNASMALLVVIALILLCGYLLKRYLPGGSSPAGQLRIIASTAVGQRERVVIVELEDTWLVLGVGNGHVCKLHELPRRDDSGPRQ